MKILTIALMMAGFAGGDETDDPTSELTVRLGGICGKC